MSTLDLHTIVESLGSPKIKTRNDALNSLQKSPYLKLAHHPKSLSALSSALLRTIEVERDAFSDNAPPAVVSRLNTASLLLREMIEASLALPASKRPRFKAYFSIVSTIAGLYFESRGEATAAPCNSDFAQIVDKLLKSPPFFDHLSVESWAKCYRFVTRAIAHELEHPKDALIRDLFSCMVSLIGGSHSVILPSVKSENYMGVLPILKKALARFSKRENPIIVSVFQVMNKLLVSLATEDFNFLHEVIHLGITTILQFSTTSLDQLFVQFLCFLNHDSFYRYFDVSRYPKLVGSTLHEADHDVYTLGMLINALLQRTQTANSKLTPSDIRVHNRTINSIYLRETHKSEIPQARLLYMAIPRLITLYYKITTKRITQTSPDSYRQLSARPPTNKRHKTQDFRANFTSCDTPLQYISSFTENHDLKLRISSLQLLLFYFDCSYNTAYLDSLSDASAASADESESIGMLMVPDSQSYSKNDVAEVFTVMLRSLTEKDLSYWALVSLRSLFAWHKNTTRDLNSNKNLSFSSSSNPNTLEPFAIEDLHQLLSLLLPMVKDRAFCEEACSLFHQIIFMCDGNELQKIYDDAMVSQLQSILDLSDIGGPAFFSNSGFDFWNTLARVFKESGSSRGNHLISILSRSVSRWIIAKCPEAFRSFPIRGRPLFSASKMANALLWLHGSDVSLRETQIRKDDRREKSKLLRSFITLEDQKETSLRGDGFVVPKISGSKDLVLLVLRTMEESFTPSPEKESSITCAIVGAIHMMIIANAIAPKDSPLADEFQSAARNVAASSARCINSKEQAALAILAVLTCKPSKDVLESICFPFELIDYHFQFLASKGGKNLKTWSTNELDVEFSSPLPVGSAKLDTDSDVSVSPVEYFEFLLLYQDFPANEVSKFMKDLSSEDYLACFDLVVRFQEFSPQPNALSLKDAIELLGNGPLSSAEYDRSETIIKLACRLVKQAYSRGISEIDSLCMDVIKFFLQCLKKELFLGNAVLVETWRVCLEYTQYNGEEIVSNADIRSLFFSSFDSFTNGMKIELSDVITTLIASSDFSTQLLFLQEICQYYPTPQSSVERSATFCLFMSLLTKKGTQICHQILFTLLELSRFESFMPYLIQGIKIIAKTQKKEDSQALFRGMRLDLIKAWITSKHDLLGFPAEAFGYVDHHSFFSENFRHITAIVCSLDAQFLDERLKQAFLDHLVDIKSCEISNLIQESLPLMVAMSYTSKGTRNKVFNILTDALQATYKPVMKEKLVLMVICVAKLTDVRSWLEIGAVAGSTDACAPKLVINISKLSTIKPGSSVDLTSALISKYSEDKNFWTVSRVFFLFRQLSLDLEHAGLTEKVAVLRRIHFFWHLSKIGFHTYSVILLVMELFSPLIGEGFDDEIAFIFNQMDLSCFKFSPVEDSSPHIITFLSHLGRSKPSDVFNRFRIRVEENLREILDPSLRPVFRFLLLPRDTRERPLIFEDVRAFMEHDDMKSVISCCYNEWASILSELFAHTYKPQTLDSKSHFVPRLVRLFLTHEIPSELRGSSFSLWVAEYLADYYLSGTSYNEAVNKGLFPSQMDEKLEKLATGFSFGSTTIDFFLQDLTEIYDTGGNKTKAFLECIFGALLWHTNDRRWKIIEWSSFHQFEHCIVSLNPRSCDYLYQEASFQPCSPGSGVETSIGNEDPFLRRERDFMLSLIPQIPNFTGLANIVTSCLLRLPELAIRTLPSFVLFFLHMAPKRSQIILDYLQGKGQIRPYCARKTELMTSIVLGIRIGAKKNIRPFKEIYENLDLEPVFITAKEGKSPESALMLFEDYFQSKAVSLVDYRSSLAEIYSSLDEYNLISGMPYDVTFDNSFKLLSAENVPENFQYDNGFMDASMALQEPFQARHMIQSLLQDGRLGLSKLVSEACYNSKETLQSSSEWSWKLNQWDAPADELSVQKHDVLYSYFKQVRDAPVDAFRVHEAEVYENSMMNFVNQRAGFTGNFINPKCRKQELQYWLETLAILRSVRTVFASGTEEVVSRSLSFEKTTSWFEAVDSGRSEDVMLARKLAFNIYTENTDMENRDMLYMCQANELSRYNNILRKERCLQKAINSAVYFEKWINCVTVHDHTQRSQLKRYSAYQAAQTLWSVGQTSIPITMLTKLDESGNVVLPFPRLSIDVHLIKAHLAKWKADSRMDLAINILQQIVVPMQTTIGEIESLSQRAQVYNVLARLCEQQYKSPVLEEKLRGLSKRVHDRKTEIEDIREFYRKHAPDDPEKKVAKAYYARLKTQFKNETDELELAKETKLSFIGTSTRFYLEAMLLDENDENVDKFFSAFFELSGNESLQESLSECLSQLSSYKPVSWCTQILSRVSDDSSAFQKNLNGLVVKICLDHPFHALYPLISLTLNESLAAGPLNFEVVARTRAARNIMSALQTSSSSYASNTLLPIERLCQQCVTLAEVKSTRGKSLHLDKLKIGSYFMNELPPIPPPTLALEVSRTGYQQVPRMMGMEAKVSIAASGLSLPKIATLNLSNGTKHKMLLKHGADDLRQDAIMEQVFGKVNRILVKDTETRKRNLAIRTYRAVPLGPRAGVIEFVAHTKALIEVIRPYHTKLDQMKAEKAREIMKKNQGGEAAQRVKAYQNIEVAIKPVLRHFFAETFLTPEKWFHSRQLYTRGVATTSMVGHILGLGDRHCNNILLDEFTGEPIHIDLGVAFDQGKRLPIPETVPFRLTRDMVDGFGFMGIHGSFSRLCEHTLRVLRGNQEHILGILDVLRWDPLYSWSISPIRKRKLQDENPAPFEAAARDASEAESAILMVTEKLHAGGLSVEATVRDLIREATSEQNLAVIYYGWYPFY